MTVPATKRILDAMLEARLEARVWQWYRDTCSIVADGMPVARFASVLSLASRYAPRQQLAPTTTEVAGAAQVLAGWTPESWTVLEAMRVGLMLARSDLGQPTAVEAFDECFRYADQGETCALYRVLAHLPDGARFVWRAGEGCRTNIVPVFEAIACDNPFPMQHFDDLAWRQLVIKAVFIGAPLWRVYGLDDRLSPELARMALDLADERRSAGRVVQHELWLCLGEHGGDRAIDALEAELASSHAIGRRAAVLALARAGQRVRLERLLADGSDGELCAAARTALDGACDQRAFGRLEERS